MRLDLWIPGVALYHGGIVGDRSVPRTSGVHGSMNEGGGMSDRVQEAIDGDATSLKLLLVETWASLGRRLVGQIPRDLRACVGPEDIVQDALIQIVRHLHTFEPRGPKSFERWATTIAFRELQNVIRWHRASKRGGKVFVLPQAQDHKDSLFALFDAIRSSELTPSRYMARDEAAEATRDALAELPCDSREAIWRVCVEGQSAVDAGAAMGRSARAIHSLCHRARERLRGLLGHPTRYLSHTG